MAAPLQPGGLPEPVQPAAPPQDASRSPWQTDAGEPPPAAPRPQTPSLQSAQYQTVGPSEPAAEPVAQQPTGEIAAPPEAPPQALPEAQPIAPPAAAEQRAIPLPRKPGESRAALRRGDLPPWLSGAVSLAIVLGLFLLVAWALRRGMPRGSAMLPCEAVEVLGRANLAGRQQVHLVRCGSKLLLVHVSPTSVETLTEITDPGEVERLAAICQHPQAGGASASFRQMLQQFARQAPAEPYAATDAGHDAGFDFANFESQIDSVGRRRGEPRA